MHHLTSSLPKKKQLYLAHIEDTTPRRFSAFGKNFAAWGCFRLR